MLGMGPCVADRIASCTASNMQALTRQLLILGNIISSPASLLLSSAAVSRSEAGQVKALLILDKDFAVVEQIPLDIGPRYFAVEPGSAPPPEGLRTGDR